MAKTRSNFKKPAAKRRRNLTFEEKDKAFDLIRNNRSLDYVSKALGYDGLIPERTWRKLKVGL